MTGRKIRVVIADGGKKSVSTIDVDGELFATIQFAGERGVWKRRGVLEAAARGLRSKLEHKARWRANRLAKRTAEKS